MVYLREFFIRPFFAGGDRPTMGGYAGRPNELVGPSTTIPDTTEPETQAEPAWMATAIGEIGVAEYAGMHNANPRIMEYFRASRYWGTDDTSAINAWCGSFAAWVFQQNGIQPVRAAFRAREWANFGKTINAPVYGALGIKSRRGGGHVSFVVGKNEAGDKLFMLGGNQDDQVKISEYSTNEWTTFVVPTDYDETRGELPVYDGNTDTAGSES